MCVSATGRCFKVPGDADLRVDAIDLVVDLSVGVHAEDALVIHVFLQVIGICCHARYLFELLWCKIGLPVFCARDVDIRLVVDNFSGEAFPLYEVDQVRGYVDNTFALLFDVKKPGGPDQRCTRYKL